MITLVFADDHDVAREGIRAILGRCPDIQILGETDNGFDVQRLVEKLRPKILLLDLKMPGPPPAEIERWVRANCPETATLILTAHERDAYLSAMIDAGASGLIGKNEPAEQLIDAIRRAAGGEILFDDNQISRARRWKERAGIRWESLTERERQVLTLLARGLSRVEAAAQLEMAPRTLDCHLAHVLKKLGVKSLKEAVLWMHAYFPDSLEI